MDGTGPLGQGEMTGRGRGKCQGAKRVFACGRRFMGLFNRVASKPKNQLDILELEEKLLLAELEALRAEKKTLTELKED